MIKKKVPYYEARLCLTRKNWRDLKDFKKLKGISRCIHREIFDATFAMVGRICPLPHGWNKVKVSKNLGATLVVPVAPVVTSLSLLKSSQRP